MIEDELILTEEAELEAVELSPAVADKPLARQSIANMALRGTSMASRFLLMVGLAHYLSPANFGIYALMYASTTLGTLFLGARFDVYSTRAICSGERLNPAVIIRDQVVFHLMVYAAVLPAMLLLFVLHILPWPLLAWFYVLLILEHSGQECNRLFVALGQPLRANFVFFVRTGLWCVGFVALMFLAKPFRNLETLWIFWFVGGVASLLLSGIWMRTLGWRVAIKEKVDWDWIKRGLKPSAAFTVAIGATTIITTVDRYFLAAKWNDDLVGVYSYYSSLTNFMPTFADTGIIAILLPTLLASAAAGDSATYERTIKKLTRGVWLVVGLAAVLSAALAPILLMIVKKAPIYSQYLPAFGLLIVSAGIATLSYIPHNALYAKHRDRDIANWSVVSMATALLAYALLTPKYGIYGACLGSLISSIAVWVGKTWAASKC